MPFLPIWVIFLQEKHSLSITQITIVDFAFWITMALTEVPTGAVADTLGRKASQLIGISITIPALMLFAYAPTYPLLLVANSLWAVSITFISGAEMAFFYDTLRELNRQTEYTKLRGQISVVGLIATGISSVLGGLLATWNITSPFWFTSGALLLALIVTSTYIEPPPESDPDTGERISFKKTLQVSIETIRKVPSLPHILLYSNLLPLCGAMITTTFIQPHAIAVGIPLASIGFLTFGLTLFRVIGAANTDYLVRRLGEWGWLSRAPVLIVIGVIGVGAFDSIFGISLLSLTVFASAASRPLIETIILRATPGSVRATILSIDNLIFLLLLAFTEPIVGIIADATNLSLSFVLMGIGIGLIMLILMPLWHRVRKAEISTAS